MTYPCFMGFAPQKDFVEAIARARAADRGTARLMHAACQLAARRCGRDGAADFVIARSRRRNALSSGDYRPRRSSGDDRENAASAAAAPIAS